MKEEEREISVQSREIKTRRQGRSRGRGKESIQTRSESLDKQRRRGEGLKGQKVEA